MTFNEYLELQSSKKITLVEIDAPMSYIWINHSPGIWKTCVSPGYALYTDDRGVTGYWDGRNSNKININSFSVDGIEYSEVASVAALIEKSWYYNTIDANLYIRFVDWLPPELYDVIAPQGVIGFTYGVDNENDNYYESIYYEPLVESIPNFSKAKDTLFFGVLQYQGGVISFNNSSGWFDNFANKDLYGQPVRILLSFEGLDYADAKLIYTGRVEDFEHDFQTFNLNVIDNRKQLSRSIPINHFSNSDSGATFYFAGMDDKYDGMSVPIAFGSVIKAPAYRTSSGNWTFADTTHNNIVATIVVYDKDGDVFTAGGTKTDGTFTGVDTPEDLTVSFTQSTIKNGLDVIVEVLDKYEDIAYNALNYDMTEWALEKVNVMDEGMWLGEGNQLTSIDIIEQICINNQGVFDVLADGRFTFRTLDEDKDPTYEIFEWELLDDPSVIYESDEFLSSVQVKHSLDRSNGNYKVYTNLDYEDEVFAHYGNRNEKIFKTTLSSKADAKIMSDNVMELSKEILPHISLTTKTQNIEVRVLDNLLYHYKRQDNSSIIDRSRYQVLSSDMDLTNYEMSIGIKKIEEDELNYVILDGGDSETDYDYYDGGSATLSPVAIIDGSDA